MSADRDQGLNALQSGNAAEAVTLLERATQADPTDYQAFMYLGAAYGQAERHTDAVTALTQAVTLQPGNAQGRYNLGIAMERAGYAPQALEAYNQALQLQPDYPKAQEAAQRLQGGFAPSPGFAAPPAGAETPLASGYASPAQGYAPLAGTETPTQYAPQGYAPQQPTQYAPPPGQPQMQGYGQPPAYGQPNMTPGQPGANPAAPYGQPAMYPGYGAAAFQNTSGMKSDVPPEVAALKFNFGAFFWSWIWLCGHNMVAAGIGLFIASFVVGLIPGIGLLITLGVQIYLGFNGHKLAWKNRTYTSFENFIEVERKWTQWAAGFFFVFFGLGLLIAILAMMNGGGGVPPRAY